jgi:two-component system response regulator YesN
MMTYKVFLVEDEIVAREGIRENVDWSRIGFEFCGEASDGEMALPLLEKSRPDVLITDIKMPFMDGLQLCKIVRERMPWVKIIILSGHDEFQYAQEAVRLGVTEYLLKPVGVQDLHQVLGKVAAQLDHDREDQATLRQLKSQIEDDLALRQEKFWLKLVMGGLASSEAIQASQRLDLDLIAGWYQVILVEFARPGQTGPGEPLDYDEYQQVGQIVARLVGHNPDIVVSKKGLAELILIMKGDSDGYLEQESHFLTELIKDEVKNKTRYTVRVGLGSPQDRIGLIHQSFTEAVTALDQEAGGALARLASNSETDKAELLGLDKSTLEAYLRRGLKDEFAAFFETYIQPLSEPALQSYLIKNYIFVDIVLTTAKFVHQLGGNVDQVIPEINYVETLLMNIKTLDQLRAEARRVFTSALDFRDSQAQNQYEAMLDQARNYIECHFHEPDLSLNDVATQVNLSPSHFSAVFSRETGETFKEYLTKLRLEKAKELLRMTSLKSFEISVQIGFNDPHYFSYVFKKHTGQSPKTFRLRAG